MTHRVRTDGLKEREHSRTQSRDAVLGLFPHAFSCPSSHPEILLLLPSKQEGGGNLHRLADWREKGQVSPQWEGVGPLEVCSKIEKPWEEQRAPGITSLIKSDAHKQNKIVKQDSNQNPYPKQS